MFASAEEKQQKSVRQLQCQEQRSTSHISLRNCGVHIFPTTFLKTAVFIYAHLARAKRSVTF